MLYDISVTPEQIAAVAAWITLGMAPVELLVDDRMLVAEQGDDRMAWDTDGSPASAEYLDVAPLDRAPSLADVHALMSGRMWSSDTTQEIAELLIRAGFTIDPPEA